jgi:phosphatidylglycerophosphate synthase
MMRKELVQDLIKLPNLFTLARFILIPVLWVLAFKGYTFYLGIGLIIAGLTDAFDGAAARRLNMVTKFGSQFDSIADHILGVSAIVWLLMLEPLVYQENKVLFLTAVILYPAGMLVGLIKFKRFANLHLYSGKLYGGLQIIFISHAFLFEGYSRWLFFLMVGVFIFSRLETLILLLSRDRVDEHMGSLFLVYWRRRAERLNAELE